MKGLWRSGRGRDRDTAFKFAFILAGASIVCFSVPGEENPYQSDLCFVVIIIGRCLYRTACVPRVALYARFPQTTTPLRVRKRLPFFHMILCPVPDPI